MIIGITGTNGSGKGAVVDHLVAKGFAHYSARKFIVEEIKRRGLKVDRTSMRNVANDLRKENGTTYITEQFLKEIKRGESAIIESVREVPSAQLIRQTGGIIIAVDAQRRTRYERAVLRGSETDKVTFEQFCEQEDREMQSADAWDMNVYGVMKLADYTITNNGSFDELHAQVDAVLEKIRK